MILLLICIILVLIGFILYVTYQFKENKKIHSEKIINLQNVIFDLLQEQKQQSLHLKLSDELKNKLLEARISIDENIMDLQHDLVSVISKKN
jgi:hypothetical protein